MYFPYQKGRYEVAPGLLPLSKDFGNGLVDQQLIQIGDDFSLFRSQFEENRKKEPVSKYVVLSKNAEPEAVGAISEFISKKLSEDYPNQITFSKVGDEVGFKSSYTHDSFSLNAKSNSVSRDLSLWKYESAWDAMGAQVPDDLAIWKLNEDGSEELEALHLNAPNHWAAQDKIGHSFAVVHKPVAHIEKITPWAVSLLEGILQKGPFVRFAWGVGTDNRLNHHPVPPPGVSEVEWAGRRFDPNQPKLYARVERQVLWGFPELKRALFTIRTYFHDVDDLKKTNPSAVKGLRDAIASMSPESLVYKGLSADRDAVLAYLDQI